MAKVAEAQIRTAQDIDTVIARQEVRKVRNQTKMKTKKRLFGILVVVLFAGAYIEYFSSGGTSTAIYNGIVAVSLVYLFVMAVLNIFRPKA